MSNSKIEEKRRGLMLVMSSPSGAGKSTLSRMLLAGEDDLTLSVSSTTREARPGEENGQDYYFEDDDSFQALVDEDGFLEHAKVFGNRYGTPKKPVEDALKQGRDVLFDIDWQGTQQLGQSDLANDLVTVFILPPTISELEDRLRRRAQDPEEVVQKRMAEAESEISHWAEYDYVLVNDDLDDTFAKLRGILEAERTRRARQPWLAGFTRDLLNERSD